MWTEYYDSTFLKGYEIGERIGHIDGYSILEYDDEFKEPYTYDFFGDYDIKRDPANYTFKCFFMEGFKKGYKTSYEEGLKERNEQDKFERFEEQRILEFDYDNCEYFTGKKRL